MDLAGESAVEVSVAFECCGIGVSIFDGVAGGGVEDFDRSYWVVWMKLVIHWVAWMGRLARCFRIRLEFGVEFRVVAGGGEVVFSLGEDVLEVVVGRAYGYSGVAAWVGVRRLIRRLVRIWGRADSGGWYLVVGADRSCLVFWVGGTCRRLGRRSG